MGAKRMRTSRQQLIEEPATLADRTANGAGADAEPARELALEGERHIELLAEALGKCLVAAGIVRPDAALTGPELLMFAEDLERALSSPDHADAGKLDAVTICKKLAPYLGATEANEWRGLKDDDAISLTVKLRVGDLRTLKAVATDEAEAGKVEGDGWLPIESAPKDAYVLAWGDNFHWRGVEKAYVHSDYNGHIGVICRHGVAGTPFSGRDAPTHWRPLPSAPSQEVAGS